MFTLPKHQNTKTILTDIGKADFLPVNAFLYY